MTLLEYLFTNSGNMGVIAITTVILVVITVGMIDSFGPLHYATLVWYASVVTILAVAAWLLWWLGAYRRTQHTVRQLAADNGWHAHTDIRPSRRHPEMFARFTASVFSIGHTRVIPVLLSQHVLPGIEIGEYRYQVGLNWGYTREVGFIRIPLERRIPHLMLVAESGPLVERRFRQDQRQELEGNFRDYFTLYCPRRYESDARFILTPDFMQTLMHVATGAHVEIINHDMYIYGEHIGLATKDKLRRALALINGVQNQALRRTERYYDDRIASLRADDEITEQGKRLSFMRTDIIIGIILFLLYIAFRLAGHLFS